MHRPTASQTTSPITRRIASQTRSFFAILGGLLLTVGIAGCGDAGDEQGVPTGVGVAGGKADFAGPDPAAQGTTLLDADGDGILDEMEDALAARFAPVLRLAPDGEDDARPANVDWYLARVKLRFNHPHCLDHDVLGAGLVTQQNLSQQSHPTASGNVLCQHDATRYTSDGKVAGDRGEFFLEPVDGSVHRGAPPADWRVYTHVRPSRVVEGGYDIQYWFFYGYDYLRTPLIDVAHEADWEHITVTTDADLGFHSAYYAQHNSGQTYGAADIEFIEGTHPVVYVARGKHASYPFVGEVTIEESPGKLFKDKTFADGPEWDTRATLINVGEPGRPLNGQDFTAYRGRWGRIGPYAKYTAGPYTPSFDGP